MLPVRAAQTVGYPATLAAGPGALAHRGAHPVPRAASPAPCARPSRRTASATCSGSCPSLAHLRGVADGARGGAARGAVTWMPRHWLPAGRGRRRPAGGRRRRQPDGLRAGRHARLGRGREGAGDGGRRRAQADTLYAADTLAGSALLVANGVPTLTGYQVTGPDDEQWEKLDPDARRPRTSGTAGRATSTSASDGPTASRRWSSRRSSPGRDVIVVTVDPCWLADSDLGVSPRRLDRPSSTARASRRPTTFTWYGGPQHVYALHAPADGPAVRIRRRRGQLVDGRRRCARGRPRSARGAPAAR